jgi:hypothetical protein
LSDQLKNQRGRFIQGIVETRLEIHDHEATIDFSESHFLFYSEHDHTSDGQVLFSPDPFQYVTGSASGFGRPLALRPPTSARDAPTNDLSPGPWTFVERNARASR